MMWWELWLPLMSSLSECNLNGSWYPLNCSCKWLLHLNFEDLEAICILLWAFVFEMSFSLWSKWNATVEPLVHSHLGKGIKIITYFKAQYQCISNRLAHRHTLLMCGQLEGKQISLRNVFLNLSCSIFCPVLTYPLSLVWSMQERKFFLWVLSIFSLCLEVCMYEQRLNRGNAFMRNSVVYLETLWHMSYAVKHTSDWNSAQYDWKCGLTFWNMNTCSLL